MSRDQELIDAAAKLDASTAQLRETRLRLETLKAAAHDVLDVAQDVAVKALVKVALGAIDKAISQAAK